MKRRKAQNQLLGAEPSLTLLTSLTSLFGCSNHNFVVLNDCDCLLIQIKLKSRM